MRGDKDDVECVGEAKMKSSRSMRDMTAACYARRRYFFFLIITSSTPVFTPDIIYATDITPFYAAV